MTRAECERKLIELAEQAVKIYHEYNPNGGRLHISTFEDGYISVSDLETVDDPDNPGNVKIANWTLDGAKNPEGEVYSMDFDDMTIEREEASA
jgi:hypothetical protein